MPDIHLPYFYNLPVAILLSLLALGEVQSVLHLSDMDVIFTTTYYSPMVDFPLWPYIRIAMITLPTVMAAGYFFRQYSRRNDLSLREAIFIIFAVNVFSSLIGTALPR